MGVRKRISSIAQRRDCALALVFRRPREGRGKRRLAASIGKRTAKEFCYLMLQCALEDIRTWRGPVVLAPEHDDDIAWARELLLSRPAGAGDAKFLAQGSGNLGMRLERLDRALLGMNFRRRIYIGSDAPALGQGHFRRVVGGLRTHDAVLANARDGGGNDDGDHTPMAWPGGVAVGRPGSGGSIERRLPQGRAFGPAFPRGF